MKKIILAIMVCVSLNAMAQKDGSKPKDSVVRIEIPREQWVDFINTIDQNIDSKKTSKALIDFIVKNAALVPKEEKKK